ncbi:hypothetical protein BJ742DRAFT_859006 [Cladochytrium replicatum]|nr:hypothetical protein BJ742DRAFT_859006 [Cladochytrium replicatum]
MEQLLVKHRKRKTATATRRGSGTEGRQTSADPHRTDSRPTPADPHRTDSRPISLPLAATANDADQEWLQDLELDLSELREPHLKTIPIYPTFSDATASPPPSTQADSSPQTYRSLTSSLREAVAAEPSAPQISDVPGLEDMEADSEEAMAALRVWYEPLQPDRLAAMFPNYEALDYADTVKEFRSSSAPPTTDPLYVHLSNYESAIVATRKVKVQLEHLQAAVHSAVANVWTMEKESFTAEALCGDLTKLKHTYVSEKAIMNSDAVARVKESLKIQASRHHEDYGNAVYVEKVSRLRVQNVLDEMFRGLGDGFPIDGNRVRSSLSILFHFERKQSGHMISASSPASSNATRYPETLAAISTDGEEPEHVPEPAILRDVRSWITFLVSFVLERGSLSDQRFILLQVLRTPGIGTWGGSFVQCSVQRDWSSVDVQHYLATVSAVLAPIEETEEVVVAAEKEKMIIKQHLKRFEKSSDWVVVDEEDLDLEPIPPPSTLLREDDYLVLLDQVQVSAVFESVATFYTGRCTQILTNFDFKPPLQLFSICGQFLSTLKRALRIFHPHTFPTLHQRLGHLVSSAAKTIQSTVSNAFEHYELDEGNRVKIFDHPLIVEGSVVTTIQSELDSFISQATCMLIPFPKLWQYLHLIPAAHINEGSKWKIMEAYAGPKSENDSLSFAKADRSIGRGRLITLLKRNPHEAQNYLQFVVTLGLSLHTPPKSLWVPDLTIKIARLVFEACYLHAEIRTLKFGLKLLHQLTCRYPALLSSVFEWVRSTWNTVGDFALEIFKAQPLGKWRMSSVDLDSLLSMLKDPLGSNKFKFAQYVLYNLNWDDSERRGETFLPKLYHRKLAISLANIYLDRKSVQAASLASAASAFIPSYISELTSGGYYRLMQMERPSDFFSWTWNMIMRLRLYQAPVGINTYALDVYDNGGKPFEPLISPSLTTMRGAMMSDALAAYLMLMVSEIGHHYHVFYETGWELLKVLVAQDAAGVVIKVVMELFPTFIVNHGEAVLIDPSFRNFFITFFKHGDIPSSPTQRESLDVQAVGIGKLAKVQWLGRDLSALVDMHLSKEIVKDSDSIRGAIGLRIWLRIVSSSETWVYNRRVLKIVDTLCEASFICGFRDTIRTFLSAEYDRMIQQYAQKVEQSSRIRIIAPIENIYSLRTSVENYYYGYPSLISFAAPPESTLSLLSRTHGHLDLAWYIYESLTVEVQIEKEFRTNAATILGDRASSASVTEVSGLDGPPKPISSFTIFKLAQLALSIPPDHPLALMVWQTFFSLYFERAPVASGHGSYFLGQKLMDGQPRLADRLIERLSDAGRKCFDVRCSNSYGEVDLGGLYSAMRSWLTNRKLISPLIIVDTQASELYPAYLRDVMDGSVLFSVYASWGLAEVASSSRRGSVTRTEDAPPSEAITPHLDVNAMVGAPLPPPAFVLSQPLLPNVFSMTADSVHKQVLDDFSLLKKRAVAFAAFVAQHDALDVEYMDLLSKLYTNEMVRARAEKQCISGKCQEAALFEYAVGKVKSVPDVKKLLRENRQQSEILLRTDNMDPRACIAAVRILLSIEWTQVQLSTGSNKIVDIATDIFFEIMQGLNSEGVAFPPIKQIAKDIGEAFGSKFVSGSDANTIKLFKQLNQVALPDFYVHVFTPAASPEHFAEMLQQIIESRHQLGDNVAAQYLMRFDIKVWSNSDAASLEIKIKFCDLILDSLLNSDISGDVCSCLHTLFRNCVKYNPSIAIPVLTHLLGHSSKSLNDTTAAIIAEFSLAINNDQPMDVHLLTSPLLQDLLISRDQSMSIISKLSDQILTAQKDRQVVSRLCAYAFLDLLTSNIISKGLYANLSEVHFSEVWNHVSAFILLWFGLDENKPHQQVSAKSVLMAEKDMVDHAATRFSQIICKLCINFATSQSSVLVWQLYKILLNTNVHDDFVFAVENTTKTTAAWKGFIFDSSIAQDILHLNRGEHLSLSDLYFICNLLTYAEWRYIKAGQPDQQCLEVVFIAAIKAHKIFPNVTERLQFFAASEQCLLSVLNPDKVSLDSLEKIISLLPCLWEPAVSNLTIKPEQESVPPESYLFCMKHLMNFSNAQDTALSEAKSRTVYDYIQRVLSSQVENNGQAGTYIETELGHVIEEFMIMLDTKHVNVGGVNVSDLLRLQMEQLFSLLNKCAKGGLISFQVSDGLRKGLKKSLQPLPLIGVICSVISAVEQMAVMLEVCISRYFELNRDPSEWVTIINNLEVPELNAEAFIRHCLRHGLVFTLYAHAQQRLREIGPNYDLRIMIGEQVASWIGTIIVDTIDEGDEAKLLIIMNLFSDLLSEELSSLPLLEHHSRLRSHLPSLGERFLRWGEDRSQHGLWAAIGFGPKSTLSVDFRFSARCIGTFIGTRLLDISGSGETSAEMKIEANTQRSRLLNTLSSLQQQREYEPLWHKMPDLVQILEDPAKPLASLSELIDTLLRVVFPDWHLHNLL